jgi:hypothetical protein
LTFIIAIAREKQIKGLRRIKKIALIVSHEPEWRDLSEDWYVRHQYQPEREWPVTLSAACRLQSKWQQAKDLCIQPHTPTCAQE